MHYRELIVWQKSMAAVQLEVQNLVIGQKPIVVGGDQ